MSDTVWYCVMCGIERPRDPAKVCPRPRCGMKAYGNRPPPHPVLPPPEPGEVRQW